MTTTRQPLLLLPLLLLFGSACEEPAQPADWHGPPLEELETVGLPVTCAPHLEYYPVGGPHNGGWDPNATTFTCGPHPSGSPDNSDWIPGDHYGNDLFAVEGTPAIAVVSGTITHSGYSGISGNRVTIIDDCGWHYFAAHLETIAPGMTVGASVTAGEQIGTVGDTGNAAGTQAHIHFSIYPESYYAGIDPFDLLQNVDGSACTGQSSLPPGEQPDPEFNPCTDADIEVDEEDPAFALVTGEVQSQTEPSTNESFLTMPPVGSGTPITVGKWGPYVSHTGKWEVDVYVPDAPFELNRHVTYDIAFHGGHAVVEIDQEANRGEWVPLVPGQPFKFVQGPRGYLGVNNAGSLGTSGLLAMDAVRWRYIGPEDSGPEGSSCDLSTECDGDLVCGQDGTCTTDCAMAGCDVGTCDLATGLCIEAGGEQSAEYDDTDGDGIPNYLEGMDDADGDGLPNQWDLDSDGDGIPDSVEGAGDADGDGTLDFLDLDADGDGMPDNQEVGSYPELPLDSDLDGVPDFRDADSDNDGIPDWLEHGGGSVPADTDSDGLPDYRDRDSDGDGIDDATEAGFVGEEPRDSDGDGVPDYLEPAGGANDGSDLFDSSSGISGPEMGWSYGCSQSGTRPSGNLALVLLLLLVSTRRAQRPQWSDD